MNGPLAFLLLLFSQSLNSDAMMWHLRGHSVFHKRVVSDLQFSMVLIAGLCAASSRCDHDFPYHGSSFDYALIF